MCTEGREKGRAKGKGDQADRRVIKQELRREIALGRFELWCRSTYQPAIYRKTARAEREKIAGYSERAIWVSVFVLPGGRSSKLSWREYPTIEDQRSQLSHYYELRLLSHAESAGANGG